MKRKNYIIYGLIILIIAAAVGYFVYDNQTKNLQTVPYAQFYDGIEKNQIKNVKIEGDKIFFNENFVTKNPHSPTLEEFLLRNGVEVTIVDNSFDTISDVLYTIFLIVFVIALVILFKRFVGPSRFKIQHKTGVKFDDIVGNDNLKRDMEQIMKIMKNPVEYAKKGIRMPKGILLVGDPGNGKTLFAKALAGEAKVNFIPAKATDFESMFIAIGPMKVKMLFAKARRCAPCIVFIDEFDGIGTKRNYSGSAIETENTRIVTALLNELDGFTPHDGILVLAATNSREALDPALIRPGRFDAKYTVPYPDYETRIALLEMYTKEKKHADSVNLKELARQFNNFSCAQIESVVNRAALLASQNQREEFTLDDVKNALREI